MFKLAAARRVLTAPGRRAMSGTSIETGHTLNTTFRQYAIPVIDTTPGAAHHHHEEVELWKKITGVGSIFVAGVFLNWLASCVPPRARRASIRIRAPARPLPRLSMLWHG